MTRRSSRSPASHSDAQHSALARAWQKIPVVLVDGYVYLVPFVENDEEIFLKTIIPSRKATKQYGGGSHE